VPEGQKTGDTDVNGVAVTEFDCDMLIKPKITLADGRSGE
jgi:hypothetical protein